MIGEVREYGYYIVELKPLELFIKLINMLSNMLPVLFDGTR